MAVLSTSFGKRHINFRLRRVVKNVSVLFNVQYLVNPRSKSRSGDRVKIVLANPAVLNSIRYVQIAEWLSPVSGFINTGSVLKIAAFPSQPPSLRVQVSKAICFALWVKYRYLLILPFKRKLFEKQLTYNYVVQRTTLKRRLKRAESSVRFLWPDPRHWAYGWS